MDLDGSKQLEFRTVWLLSRQSTKYKFIMALMLSQERFHQFLRFQELQAKIVKIAS